MHTPSIGSVSEPLKFMDDITTEAVIQLRDESGRYLSTAQVVSRIQVVRACFRPSY